MPNKFENQVAVVTGGSSGIGLSIARGLIAEGAKTVYITGRTKETINEAIQLLGSRAIGVVSDVSNLSDLNTLLLEIDKRGDKLNTIFANAGIAENNNFGQTTESEFLKTFNINVKGIFFTVQTLLPLLKNGGAIVLTSSIVANKGMENLSLYSASKAAVRSFARSWANDLKVRKIRVNAISPGLTRTAIQEKGLKMNETQIEDFHKFAAEAVPLGYVAQPHEIATSALFLASSEASYINGIELTVDGGFSQI